MGGATGEGRLKETAAELDGWGQGKRGRRGWWRSQTGGATKEGGYWRTTAELVGWGNRGKRAGR